MDCIYDVSKCKQFYQAKRKIDIRLPLLHSKRQDENWWWINQRGQQEGKWNIWCTITSERKQTADSSRFNVDSLLDDEDGTRMGGCILLPRSRGLVGFLLQEAH